MSKWYKTVFVHKVAYSIETGLGFDCRLNAYNTFLFGKLVQHYISIINWLAQFYYICISIRLLPDMFTFYNIRCSDLFFQFINQIIIPLNTGGFWFHGRKEHCHWLSVGSQQEVKKVQKYKKTTKHFRQLGGQEHIHIPGGERMWNINWR